MLDGEKEEETENDKKKQSQDDIDETVAKCKFQNFIAYYKFSFNNILLVFTCGFSRCLMEITLTSYTHLENV